MLDARGNCKKCARKMIFARLVDVDRPMMEGCRGRRQKGVTPGQRATVWRLQLAVSLTRQTAWRRRNASYAYKWSGSAQQGGQGRRERERESWEQEQRLKVKNVKAFVMSTSNNNKERDGMRRQEQERKRAGERQAEWESCYAHYIAHSESLRLCL